MSKVGYIQAALQGRECVLGMVDAALVFYHCDVPLDDAREYMRRLEAKLRRKRAR